MQTNKGENLIVELTFSFAVKIIRFCETFEKARSFVLSTLLLKSGTSIGANVREPQNAESKIDFIHKMKVAAKEADESEYWLLLCKETKSNKECDELIRDCRSIQKVLSKIISVSKAIN